MNPHERILVALDTSDVVRARDLARRLSDHVGGVKIGLELFTVAGPDVVREMRALGLEVFLDLKLHDIPNTVGRAAAAAARLEVAFFTVHALGGTASIRAAAEAAADATGTGNPAVLLAVTVLTSHDDEDLAGIGISGPCRPAVVRLATLARDAGAGGLVCSPLEIADARAVFPSGALVVPGIRPEGYGRADDQARTSTPSLAVSRGADRLVVGRPITAAPDPVAAADAIARELPGS